MAVMPVSTLPAAIRPRSGRCCTRMLVDLHAHFPMHLLPDEQQRAHERAGTWWRQRWQAWVVELISRVANYEGPSDSPSVTEGLMRAGNVSVALSVLYQPFNEMD